MDEQDTARAVDARRPMVEDARARRASPAQWAALAVSAGVLAAVVAWPSLLDRAAGALVDVLTSAPPGPPPAPAPSRAVSLRPDPDAAPTRPVASRVVQPSVRATSSPASPPAATGSEPLREPLPRLVPVLPMAPAAPPAGRAGLVDALRRGVLQPANAGDLRRWALRHARHSPAGAGMAFEARAAGFDAYRIVGGFEFPPGLHGAHAVVFVLDEGVPFPAGDPGHSAVLDVGSGSCLGVTCAMLLAR